MNQGKTMASVHKGLAGLLVTQELKETVMRVINHAIPSLALSPASSRVREKKGVGHAVSTSHRNRKSPVWTANGVRQCTVVLFPCNATLFSAIRCNDPRPAC